MAYRVLPHDLVALLLKDETDELTAAGEARIRQIKQTPCPRCGSALQPTLNRIRPFRPNDPLPHYLATCECGFEADPVSGLVVQLGSAAKVPETLPLVKAKPE